MCTATGFAGFQVLPTARFPLKVAIIKISQERGYDKRLSPGGSELGRVLMAMEADGNLQEMIKLSLFTVFWMMGTFTGKAYI
jgi:hypothetical protein